MIAGARRLPTQHLSIRVPWHDSGWNGTVCAKPSSNTACRSLARIAEYKDDAAENEVAQSRPIDLETFEALEEALLLADVGVAASDRIVDAVRARSAVGSELRALVKAELLGVFQEADRPAQPGGGAGRAEE